MCRRLSNSPPATSHCLAGMAAAVLALLVYVISAAARRAGARADDRAFLAADQAARRAADGRADADALGGFALARFGIAMVTATALRRFAADVEHQYHKAGRQQQADPGSYALPVHTIILLVISDCGPI